MKLLDRAEHIGLENRINQTIEECAELIHILCKYKRILEQDKTCDTSMSVAQYHIAEEIADVKICLEQLEYLLQNKNQVEALKQHKLERTEQRILYSKHNMI